NLLEINFIKALNFCVCWFVFFSYQSKTSSALLGGGCPRRNRVGLHESQTSQCKTLRDQTNKARKTCLRAFVH
ncbi:MAG: hypothetical protein ACTHK7_21985, partial [Aureliella sp.]